MLWMEAVFDRYIGDDSTLDVLATILKERASSWFGSAVLEQDDGESVPVSESDFRSLVLQAALRRGPLYKELVQQYGAGDERAAGDAEIRGRGTDLTVVVGIDAKPQARVAGCLLLNNRISIQVGSRTVARMSAPAWAAEVLRALCEKTSPFWGAAYALEEYDAKVMSAGPTVAAVGRDFSRYLPGLFAVNFIGPGLVEEFGIDVLQSTPHADVEPVGGGFMLLLRDPPPWRSTQRADLEAEIVKHLGRKHFYAA